MTFRAMQYIKIAFQNRSESDIFALMYFHHEIKPKKIKSYM